MYGMLLHPVEWRPDQLVRPSHQQQPAQTRNKCAHIHRFRMSIAKWYRSTPLPSLRTHSWMLRIVTTFSVFANLLRMAAFSVRDESSSR